MSTLIAFDEIDSRISSFDKSPLSDRYESYPVLRGIIYTLIALGWEGTPEILSDTFKRSFDDKQSFIDTIDRSGYQSELVDIDCVTTDHTIECPAFISLETFNGIILEYEEGKANIYDYKNDQIITKSLLDKQVNLCGISKYSALFREPPPESRDSKNWVKHCFSYYTDELKNLMILSFFITLFSAINPFFIMGIYSFALPSTSISSLIWLSIGAILVSYLEYLFKRYRMNILSSSGKELAIYISFHVTSKLLWLPYAMTSSAGVSSQLARLKDIDQFRKLVTADSTLSYFDFPYIFIYILAIMLLSGIGAITVVVGIFVMLIFCLFARKQYQQVTSKNSKANAMVSYQWNEILGSLRSIQGLPLLQVIQTRFKASHTQSIEDADNVAITTSRTQQIGSSMIQVIGTTSIVFAVVAVMEGLSDPSSMIVIIILVWKALSPIMGIYNALTRLKTVQASSQQIDALMSLTDDRLNLEKSPPINYLYGNIELAGISHRYQGAQIGLTNLGFKINSGNTITISGPPGSGRSTLLKIMAGIESNYQGVVLCEGYNIRQFNNYRYRSAVKYVPFNMHFFDGSVADNFNLYNSEMRTEDMWFILQHFKLRECLPNGLETRLDPMFVSHLSNGEFQLLRLAIQLGDFKQGIIIIDEPLIGCGNEFTTLFTALKGGPLKNKTIIMSTNEPSLIAASENCLLLDSEGAQKFYGTPDKVLDSLDN
mgnify:FL=1